MYLINTEITVNWVIPMTQLPKPVTDFDISIKDPDGLTTYTEAAIAPENYIVPTESTTGAISYPFTPNKLGLWIVTLSVGVEGDYEINYEYPLRISQNDTHVYQQVRI